VLDTIAFLDAEGVGPGLFDDLAGKAPEGIFEGLPEALWTLLRQEGEAAQIFAALRKAGLIDAVGAPEDRLFRIHRTTQRVIRARLGDDATNWAAAAAAVVAAGYPFDLADIHRRIGKAGYLRGSSPAEFAMEAGVIIGDVNHVHPFREGNGRTQLQYLNLEIIFDPASSPQTARDGLDPRSFAASPAQEERVRRLIRATEPQPCHAPRRVRAAPIAAMPVSISQKPAGSGTCASAVVKTMLSISGSGLPPPTAGDDI